VEAILALRIGQPNQVHLGCVVHLNNGHEYQYVHDVVRIEPVVKFAWKPLLGDPQSANDATEYSYQVLEPDVREGCRMSGSVSTGAHSDQAQANEDREKKTKTPVPGRATRAGFDSFIEAPKACEGVKERYQHTKEWRKTIYGREDGGEGTNALRHPDSEHIQLQQASVNAVTGRVVHKRVVNERSEPWTKNAQ